jgi:hypothetical protein
MVASSNPPGKNAKFFFSFISLLNVVGPISSKPAHLKKNPAGVLK